jgi:hypothetical protein
MGMRGHRVWFYVAICCSVLAVMDLISITVESYIKEMPDSVRCKIVNTVLSLPFDTEYKLKEARVRSRTNCMIADRSAAKDHSVSSM